MSSLVNINIHSLCWGWYSLVSCLKMHLTLWKTLSWRLANTISVFIFGWMLKSIQFVGTNTKWQHTNLLTIITQLQVTTAWHYLLKDAPRCRNSYRWCDTSTVAHVVEMPYAVNALPTWKPSYGRERVILDVTRAANSVSPLQTN